MQFALGSVLKLTRSAFGGLGSFRTPSIRRALPVLLGGLLCAVGSAAMAQQSISGVSFVSTPTGGTSANPNSVYIIGDTVEVQVEYAEALAAVTGSPKIRVKLDADPADTDTTKDREAACERGSPTTVLVCRYTVKEGDDGDGASVPASAFTVIGNLPGGQNTRTATTSNAVDGVRLAIDTAANSGITVALPDSATRPGAKAGEKIEVTIDFAGTDQPVFRSGFGVSLVLDNAERAMAHIADADPATLKFRYTVVDGDNARQFKLKLTGAENLRDSVGNTGFMTGEDPDSKIVATAIRRVDTQGPRINQVRVASDPAAGASAYKASEIIQFVVDFNEQLGTVASGTVNLDVLIGTKTVSAGCARGDDSSVQSFAGSTSQLGCTHTVADQELDNDGVSISANPLAFGSALTDDVGNVAINQTAAKQFRDEQVDAVAPTIASVRVSVPQAKLNNSIKVTLTFSEAVEITSDSPPATLPSVAVTVEDGTGGAANYARQTSATALELRYQLQTGDVNLHSTAADADNDKDVTLGAVTIGDVKDLAGNGASSALPVDLPDWTLRQLATFADTTRPTLERIALYDVPDSRRYGTGTPIQFEVLFSESVTIEGTVSLEGKIGTQTDIDVALSGTASRFAVSHPVVAGDCANRATCSISISGVALDADGSRVTDGERGWENDSAGDTPAASGVTETTKISRSLTAPGGGTPLVDTRPPTIESVKLLTNPGPTDVGDDGRRYYGGNAKIWIEIAMSEDVKVTLPTSPSVWTIPLTVAAETAVPATYLKDRSTSKKLIFEYTVPVGQGTTAVRDIDGIQVNQLTSDGDATVEDLAGNDATFTHAAVQSAVHRVDGSLGGEGQTLPSQQEPGQAPVNPVGTANVPTPSDGYYTEGDTFTITVPLTRTVTFTEAPRLTLTFDEGGSQRLTALGSFLPAGSPKTSLSFRYLVASGDETNGFTGQITGGGVLTVESGESVNLGQITISGIRIDALAPELETLAITSSAGSDGTYVAGDNIVITATFSEDVERQGTADPSVPILVGDSTKTATLQSPSSTAGGDTWVFRYTVVAGDSDADGVSIAANALDGDLEDAAGNEATITHDAVAASTSHRVDTQGPRVTGVAVTGAGTDNLFVEGDTITATVTFDEAVDVVTTGSNAVRVRFNIGTSSRTATYAGGDDTTTLTFTYEVVAGDSGVISLPANALEGEAEDAAGNAAGSTPAVPLTPYMVDASAPMLVGAPSITSSPASGDTYVAGEMITIEVGFDEPVVVTGTPRIYLTVGPKRRFAAFTGASTSGADLRFGYTVRAGDTDDDGVSIAANELKLTSGATIQDRNGLSVASSEGTVMHPAVSNQSGHKVDAVAPMVESLAITSNPASGDAYLIDETIEVTVTFNEDVTTEGSPMLGIMIGTGTRNATCAQSGGRMELMCSYTVAANDFDADGVSVNADSLSGTITDVPGNPATLTHDALADDPDHKVYAAAPEAVRTIATLSMAAGGATNSLDLEGIFTGFQLTYSATSSDTNVAMPTIAGSELTVSSGMEGTATVTVTATNLAGSASTTFGVIVATDPVEKAVLNDALAAIGRSMLSSTANVISSRFELAATSSEMALGGSRFGGSLSPEMQRFLAGNDPFALEERMSERALFSGSGAQQAYGGGYGLTADRLFTGTSFNMPLSAVGTGDTQFAIWGAGDLQSFEGEPDDGMYDGSSSSGYIGVDARGDGWLAGVSVSRSGAEADYDFDNQARTGVMGGGTLETAVTAFHPYARLEVGPDSEIWVIGGFGGGEADLSRTHVSGTQSSDLSMAMAVGGLRRALAMEFGGANLSLRGDAGFLSLETDSGMMAIDGLSASVSRLRLGLEAAWEGESATPFVEVSGRFDGGDGQTGGGLELAGGIRILNSESGFGLEAKGRVLAMHTGEGYSESGIGVTASFEPGAAGRGITFRLSPRWGGSADSTDLFWDEVGNVRDASQYAYGLDRAQTWGVDAALGYGFGLRSMPGVVTPFGQMDVTGDQDQRLRVGVRYGLMQGLLGGTQVELSAERVDGEMYPVGETRVLVSGRARF